MYVIRKKIKTISKQVLISYSVRKIPPILFFYFYITPSFEIVHLIGRRMRVIVLDDHCRNIWLSDLNFFLIDKRSAPLIESSSQKATETLFTEYVLKGKIYQNYNKISFIFFTPPEGKNTFIYELAKPKSTCMLNSKRQIKALMYQSLFSQIQFNHKNRYSISASIHDVVILKTCHSRTLKKTESALMFINDVKI